MPSIHPNTYVDPDVIVSPTVANLRLQAGSANAIAILLGNAAAFDQAITVWGFDADSEDADDGVNVIAPTVRIDNETAGRWRSPA